MNGEFLYYTAAMDHYHYQNLKDMYSNAEWRAIEEHKYYLSLEAGYDVGEQYAVKHWEAHYAKRWRRERLKRELAAQQREIFKHKWLESEKACTDLGQQAVHDWIVRFAKPWRQWHRGQENK